MCDLWACVRYPRIAAAFGHTAHGHRGLLRSVRLLTESNSVESEATLLIRFLAMRPDSVLKVPQAGPDTVKRVEAAQMRLRYTTEEEACRPSPHGSATSVPTG